MASLEEDNEISKTAAKRKFLLTDEDLAVVPFKLKPNPMNKGYGKNSFYLRFFFMEIKNLPHSQKWFQGGGEPFNNKKILSLKPFCNHLIFPLWECAP